MLREAFLVRKKLRREEREQRRLDSSQLFRLALVVTIISIRITTVRLEVLLKERKMKSTDDLMNELSKESCKINRYLILQKDRTGRQQKGMRSSPQEIDIRF